MGVVTKQLVYGVSEGSRAGMAGPGGVLRVLEGCSIISELWAVILNRAGQGRAGE